MSVVVIQVQRQLNGKITMTKLAKLFEILVRIVAMKQGEEGEGKESG